VRNFYREIERPHYKLNFIKSTSTPLTKDTTGVTTQLTIKSEAALKSAFKIMPLLVGTSAQS